MDRKNFLKSSLIAGSAMAAGTGAIGAETIKNPGLNQGAKTDFNLNYAPHFGMFRHHAGEDPIDQLKFMADAGFTALEDNGLMRRSVDVQNKIGQTLAKLDMTMGVFVIDKGGNAANSLAAGKPEYVEIFWMDAAGQWK